MGPTATRISGLLNSKTLRSQIKTQTPTIRILITVTFDSHFKNDGILTVDGSALHNLTGTNLTVDAHLATHDSFVFIGSGSADTLIGGSKNDIFIGNGGGNTMTGGGGSDIFVFKALTDLQPASAISTQSPILLII